MGNVGSTACLTHLLQEAQGGNACCMVGGTWRLLYLRAYEGVCHMVVGDANVAGYAACLGIVCTHAL